MSEGVWPTLLRGDCRAVLQTLEAESVHLVCTSPPYFGLRRYLPSGHPDEALEIGSEDSPEAWVENLVAVFREVKRVLRSDGTLWVNCGDAYAGSWGNQGRKAERGTQRPINGPMLQNLDAGYPAQKSNTGKCSPGLKPKDLIGLPWMLAFALRADGWWLRSDVIWEKPNPMPESVTDRPTRSHEYLFLFAKSERYYMDMDAIRETGVYAAGTKGGKGSVERSTTPGVNSRPPEYKVYDGNRNKRSVWNIPTQPVAFAHFACFPEALVEPCILSGSSERGCCPACSAPWRRVVDRTPMVINRSERTHEKGRTRTSGHMVSPASSETTGWEPTCSHDYPEAQLVPATCLDPFVGSGTTCRVAMRLGRRSIGIDLSSTYLEEIARRRTEQGALGI